LEAGLQSAQAALEAGDQATRDVFALRRCVFFSAGVFFFHGIPHSGGHGPVEREAQDQHEPVEPIRAFESSRSVRSIWLSSRLKPRVL
jgi:hypothetical protein